MKSIVIGTDGSPTAQAAVRAAVDLVGDGDVHIHLVGACRPLSALVSAEPAGMLLAVEAEQARLDSLQESLTEDAKRLAAQGLTVSSHAAVGDPADLIISMAEQVRADLIVVGNRGMQGARRFLGSVPNRVSHHAPCTVLVVRTT